MRLTALLAILILVMLAATAVFAEEFVDSSGTFSLQIADGWNAQETQDVLSLAGPNGIAQVNISKLESDGATLDAFAKAFEAELKKSLPKFKLVSYNKTKVGGVPAGVWVYTAEIDSIPLKFKNYVIFPKNTDVLYNAVLATVVQSYKTDVADFDAMMKSWSWSES